MPHIGKRRITTQFQKNPSRILERTMIDSEREIVGSIENDKIIADPMKVVSSREKLLLYGAWKKLPRLKTVGTQRYFLKLISLNQSQRQTRGIHNRTHETRTFKAAFFDCWLIRQVWLTWGHLSEDLFSHEILEALGIKTGTVDWHRILQRQKICKKTVVITVN